MYVHLLGPIARFLRLSNRHRFQLLRFADAASARRDLLDLPRLRFVTDDARIVLQVDAHLPLRRNPVLLHPKRQRDPVIQLAIIIMLIPIARIKRRVHHLVQFVHANVHMVRVQRSRLEHPIDNGAALVLDRISPNVQDTYLDPLPDRFQKIEHAGVAYFVVANIEQANPRERHVDAQRSRPRVFYAVTRHVQADQRRPVEVLRDVLDAVIADLVIPDVEE